MIRNEILRHDFIKITIHMIEISFILMPFIFLIEVFIFLLKKLTFFGLWFIQLKLKLVSDCFVLTRKPVNNLYYKIKVSFSIVTEYQYTEC
jgi:hypothetical protein